MSNRKAVFAGRFYPAESSVLRMSVTKAFRDASKVAFSAEGQPGGKDPSGYATVSSENGRSAPWTMTSPLLTVLPHAGIQYSGAVAAAALKGTNLPRRLIVLAPNHTGAGHSLAFWPDGLWESPFGRVPVDEELGRELFESGDDFQPDIKAHQREHSIEILLPFLQTVQPDVRVLPIVMSRNYQLDRVAKAVAGVIAAHQEGPERDRVGLIVSTDMNHYAPENLNRVQDFKAIDAMLRLDADGLADVVRENRISMCGVFGAYVGIKVCDALGATHTRLMGYCTSSLASGDPSSVVGYAGIRAW